MTDEDVVRRFAEVVGVGKVTMRARRPNRKQQWQWRAFGAAAMARLDEAIGPWLGVRRRAKLDEMLAFEPRRDGLRGRWIGTRWFADPNLAVLTDDEVRSLLLLGRTTTSIARVSARRIARIRREIDPELLARARRLRV